MGTLTAVPRWHAQYEALYRQHWARGVRLGRAGPRAIEEIDLGGGEPTPERAALQGEARERIWRAFQRLPPRQREVFVLRHLEGWSTEAAAEALALSSGSGKRHLLRAGRRLRGALGGDS